MSGPNDRRREICPRDELDVSIERLLRGVPVDEELERLAPVVDELRALTGGPSPRPSSDLARLLADGAASTPRRGLVPLGSRPRHRWQRVGARITARAAGLSLASKVGLGLALAGAGAAGAGAAGVIPRSAVDAVRHTLDVVTPFEFAEGAIPEGTGDQVRRSGASSRPRPEPADANQPRTAGQAPDRGERTAENPEDHSSPTPAPQVPTGEGLAAETAAPTQAELGQDSNPSGVQPPTAPSPTPNQTPANAPESGDSPPPSTTDDPSTGHDHSPPGDRPAIHAGSDPRPARPEPCGPPCAHDRSRAGSGPPTSGHENGGSAPAHHGPPPRGAPPHGGSPPAATVHPPAVPDHAQAGPPASTPRHPAAAHPPRNRPAPGAGRP